MKQQSTNAGIIILETLVKQVNEYLTNAHQKLLKTVVLVEAKNFAKKNLPCAGDPIVEPFISGSRGAYKSLQNEVAIQLQGSIQKSLGAVNLATANDRIEAKKQTIRKVEEQIEHLQADKDRIHLESDHSSYKRLWWLFVLLALGEVLWTTASFLKMGDTVLLSLLIGITIGVAQVSAVKTAVQLIKELKDAKKQIKYFILTAIVSIVFSFCLSMLRYWFIHKVSGSSIPFIVMNPFTFVAINMVFVVATGLLVFFNYPSKEELRKLREVEAIDHNIEKAKLEKEKLNIELTELMQERERLIELRSKIMNSEKNLFQRVDSLYEEAIGLFKNENTTKRSDGLYPPAFRSKHEPLPSFTSDDHLLQ